MKTIKNCGAQGDIFLRRIAALPEGAREIAAVNGRHVVAHSETGHDHYVEADGVGYYAHTDPNVCYLRVEGAWADVQHARSFDTHEAIRISTGLFEVRRQVEMTPEGWKQVQD